MSKYAGQTYASVVVKTPVILYFVPLVPPVIVAVTWSPAAFMTGVPIVRPDGLPVITAEVMTEESNSDQFEKSKVYGIFAVDACTGII